MIQATHREGRERTRAQEKTEKKTQEKRKAPFSLPFFSMKFYTWWPSSATWQPPGPNKAPQAQKLSKTTTTRGTMP